MTSRSSRLTKAARRARAIADVSASLEAFGLDPADALADIADVLRMYSTPSLLSSVHRELMLQWFGSSDTPLLRIGPLRREEIVEIAVRMGALDTVTSYSVEATAALLSESPAEIVRRVEFGELWAFGHHEPLIPAWQFTDDAEPAVISEHLPTIVQAIPTNAPPALVRGLMTLDDPQLSRNLGVPTSPRAWLLSHRPPMPVVALLLRYLEGNDDRLLRFIWGAA